MSVSRILVPADGDNQLWLHAVYFAFEFAKRTGAKILFLVVGQDTEDTPAQPQTPDPAHEVARRLELAVSSARLKGVEVETYVTRGDYVERVAAFAREHHASRIVVALPEPDSEAFARVNARVNALRGQLGCVLVTVRPRPDRLGAIVEHEHRIGAGPFPGER